MNKEIKILISRLENTNTGEPWFGRAAYQIFEEADEKKVFIKPGGTEHSMIELLYHMITWADFTLKRIEKDSVQDPAVSEKMDWPHIDHRMHTWKKGITEFKSIQKKIIIRLKKKEDSFLQETVDYRKYNFHFLINGMIEHNIYHLGQIAYLHKMLK